MIKVATIILDQNFCHLHEAFEVVSPKVKYSADRAITKLLQMPLAAVRIGEPQGGVSFTIILERFPGTDYLKMASLLNRMSQTTLVAKGSASQGIERSFMKMLLNLTQSSRERECLRVAIFKASGISATKARRLYGFEKMDERAVIVEQSIMEAKRIREAVEELAETQDKALMEAYGLLDLTDSSDDCTESDEEIEPQYKASLPDSLMTTLSSLLVQSQYNWFEFHEKSVNVLEGVNDLTLSEFFFED